MRLLLQIFHVPARKALQWRYSTIPPTYLLPECLLPSLTTSAIFTLVKTACPLDCIAFVLFHRHSRGEMRYLAPDATTAGPFLTRKQVCVNEGLLVQYLEVYKHLHIQLSRNITSVSKIHVFHSVHCILLLPIHTFSTHFKPNNIQ